jgi:hypothetical protein
MTTPTKLPNPVYSDKGRGMYGNIKCFGSASVTPGAILNNASATGTITVLGAALGDYVDASYGVTLQGCTLSASVSDGDTVTWVITNNTGGSITPAAATTLRVLVFYATEGYPPTI